MVRYARLRFSSASITSTALFVGLIATALCFAALAALPAGASANSQAPVAAWSFDEGTGTAAHDLSGDENEGTVEGGTEWKPGRYGDSLQFASGEGECVTVPNSSTLQLPEEVTIEAWIRPEGSLVNDPIVAKEGGEEEPDYSYRLGLGVGPSGTLEGYAGEEEVRKAGVIEPDVWAHVAFTYDGARDRLYVDGEQVASEYVGSHTLASKGPLKIGCSDVGGQTFHGRIDEVRIYERALSGGEVAIDRGVPLQTPVQGPVAEWSFDDGNEETAEDHTGDGHEGTIEGGAKAVPGRYGQGLHLDGETGCVSIEATPELQPTEEFTAEAWVRPDGSPGQAESVISLNDPEAGEGEEGFAYELLGGGEEAPKAWARKDGEGGYEGVYASAPLDADVWAHLVLTDDGGHLRLYVNGGLAATAAAPEHLGAAAGPLTIGCDAFGSHFKGRIDEVHIYNRALSGGEVDASMEAPIGAPKQAPVAAYSFDEGTGTAVEDLSGDANEGTVEGGAEWKPGRYGDSLQFASGEGECVTVPNSSTLQLPEEVTIEAWIRPEGSLVNDPIVSKETEEGGYSYRLGLGVGPSGTLEGYAGEEEVRKAGVIEPDVWAHVAFTYDGARDRLYVDGEQVASEYVGSHTLASKGPLKIGCSDVGGQTFHGRIDEVRIYERALSGGEVADVLAPRFDRIFHVYASQIEGVETTEIFFQEAEDPPLPNGEPGSGVDIYRYRTSVNGAAYTGWEETSAPYFGLTGVHEGDVISVQLTLRDHVWNESGVYESTVIVPPAGTPTPGEYSPEEGVPGAPGGSCAAEPERSGCPPVERIIVVPPGEEDSTPYGPKTSPRGAGSPSPQAVPSGDKCAVKATVPKVTLFKDAHTEAENECLPGFGVIYTELFATLYKEQEDGGEQFRGTTPSGRRTGAGLTRVNRYSECHGAGRLDDFAWKAEATAYTDIEGTGYWGTNVKFGGLRCN